MNDFTIKGSLVKDHIHKRSYNLTNKFDAIKLCETLTNYEKEVNTLNTLEKKFDEANKQLTHLSQTLTRLQNDINTLTNQIREREK
jgi:peptidoglycan hydrolase CwlO-like protein